jgi:hypothetical protein
MTDDLAGRCGTCGAYIRKGTMEGKGPVGACAREVYPFPVLPTFTCSAYRDRNAPAPPPKRPRARSTSTSSASGSSMARAPLPPLPTEIDLDMDIETFRSVLTEVLREELGTGDAELGGRWEGGEIILKPGKEGTAEKRLPIDAFFHKVVMLRDKLRVLEQRINSHATLTDEEKIAMQQYVTGCYGTLTTFNVLFADPKRDGFKGAGGKDE